MEMDLYWEILGNIAKEYVYSKAPHKNSEFSLEAEVVLNCVSSQKQ